MSMQIDGVEAEEVAVPVAHLGGGLRREHGQLGGVDPAIERVAAKGGGEERDGEREEEAVSPHG